MFSLATEIERCYLAISLQLTIVTRNDISKRSLVYRINFYIRINSFKIRSNPYFKSYSTILDW